MLRRFSQWSRERILHPLVRQEIGDITEKKSVRGEDLLVEVPLMFEVGWQDDFDRTVLIYASREICLERIMIRDQASRIDGEKVLDAQMDIGQKVWLADSVIDNSGSWPWTVLQMYHLKRILRRLGNK